MPMTDQVSIPLDTALHARLLAVSERLHLNEQGLVLRALEEFLDRDEIYRRELAEDEERWQEYQKTGVAVPHEEMLAWMDKEISSLSAKLHKPQ